MKEKEWYTSSEAAAYLKIPMHRLSRLRRLGRVKGIEGGGENTRYALYHISELKKADVQDKRKERKKPSLDDDTEKRKTIRKEQGE